MTSPLALSTMSFLIASGPGDFAFFDLLIPVISSWREIGRLTGERGFARMLCAALASRSCAFVSIS